MMEAQSYRIDRLREAAKYQRMAFSALLPEELTGHIDVIENEFKAMLKDTVIGIVKHEMMKQYGQSQSEEETSEQAAANTDNDCTQGAMHAQRTVNTSSSVKVKKTRKITID